MRRFRFDRATSSLRFTLLATAAITTLLVQGTAARQTKRYPLESATGLRLQNVSAVPATLQGKKGLKITISDQSQIPPLALVEGLEFGSGTIEAEIAGAPAPGAPEAARGFVGIAFRLQNDMKTYDVIYLRPTNGRADDQERRNHAVQYASHPDWPWFRLRKETPSKYEAYVDLMPDTWTKIKIDVRGERARLYVHNQEQPTLIVNDLKTGAAGKGAIALFLDSGTVAHFRNLTVQSSSTP